MTRLTPTNPKQYVEVRRRGGAWSVQWRGIVKGAISCGFGVGSNKLNTGFRCRRPSLSLPLV